MLKAVRCAAVEASARAIWCLTRSGPQQTVGVQNLPHSSTSASWDKYDDPSLCFSLSMSYLIPVLLQTSPKYLKSNATSHTWAFSAIAELVGKLRSA